MYNLDGSRAQMCGNGIRCVGKYVYEKQLTDKTSLEIETLGGIKKLELKVRNHQVYSVSVRMGIPRILEETELDVLYMKFRITPVFLGNPHAVIFVNTLEHFDFEKYAILLEDHRIFPNKTNVEFVQVMNPNLLRVKVWERGSGATLACGTGACAATAVAFEKKFIYQSTNVELPGGFLQTYVDTKTQNIYMSGPATLVYDGFYHN